MVKVLRTLWPIGGIPTPNIAYGFGNGFGQGFYAGQTEQRCWEAFLSAFLPFIPATIALGRSPRRRFTQRKRLASIRSFLP